LAQTTPPVVALASRREESTSAASVPAFDEIYDEHFAFVWRSVRRLGVADGAVDDVVQEVFIVVHRRLAEFAGRSSLRTWLFGIALRVVRDHRRTLKRKSPHLAHEHEDPETVGDARERGPHESTERAEAARLVRLILDELDDEHREVFVMAELEQMTVPEIADALGENVNTVYSRLRAARQKFEQAAARLRARDGWRMR